MNHAQAIRRIRVAGYHDDGAALAEIVTASRIKSTAATTAWRYGRKLRARGVQCGCNICYPKST